MLGAEDGAAHVCFFDGGVVEDEVEEGGGVGDAVGYHRIGGGGGIEGGGRVQGESRKLDETARFRTKPLTRQTESLLCSDMVAEQAGNEGIQAQSRRIKCCWSCQCRDIALETAEKESEEMRNFIYAG